MRGYKEEQKKKGSDVHNVLQSMKVRGFGTIQPIRSSLTQLFSLSKKLLSYETSHYGFAEITQDMRQHQWSLCPRELIGHKYLLSAVVL